MVGLVPFGELLQLSLHQTVRLLLQFQVVAISFLLDISDYVLTSMNVKHIIEP